VRSAAGRVAGGITLLAAVAAGCGSGDGSSTAATRPAPPRVAPAGVTSLRVTYFPHGSGGTERHNWSLKCSPTGGNHPLRGLACAELAAHAHALAPARRACRFLAVRTAAQALVAGTNRGIAVHRLFRPGCDSEWTSLHALLYGS
jgi:hypothetical protein